MIYCQHCNRLDIAAWLQTKGISIGPPLAANLEEILRPGFVPEGVETLGIPEATLRFRLRKKGLPTPRKWVELARAIAVVYAIAANPRMTLGQIAPQMGVADHSALCHLLRRTLDIKASDVRAEARLARLGIKVHVVGLVELLERWWHLRGGPAERSDR